MQTKCLGFFGNYCMYRKVVQYWNHDLNFFAQSLHATSARKIGRQGDDKTLQENLTWKNCMQDLHAIFAICKCTHYYVPIRRKHCRSFRHAVFDNVWQKSACEKRRAQIYPVDGVSAADAGHRQSKEQRRSMKLWQDRLTVEEEQ